MKGAAWVMSDGKHLAAVQKGSRMAGASTRTSGSGPCPCRLRAAGSRPATSSRHRRRPSVSGGRRTEREAHDERA
ncbi:hypothetical protein G7085_00550 [Tessaracoccus sp. HDW20]|nr:hypothetical protein [Tessaracoccus coleopterorum]